MWSVPFAKPYFCDLCSVLEIKILLRRSCELICTQCDSFILWSVPQICVFAISWSVHYLVTTDHIDFIRGKVQTKNVRCPCQLICTLLQPVIAISVPHIGESFFLDLCHVWFLIPMISSPFSSSGKKKIAWATEHLNLPRKSTRMHLVRWLQTT